MQKKCNICGYSKGEEDFQKDNSRKNGIRQPCKACIAHKRRVSLAKSVQAIWHPKSEEKIVQTPSKVKITPENSLLGHLKGKNWRIQGNDQSDLIHLIISNPHKSIEGKTFEELEAQL